MGASLRSFTHPTKTMYSLMGASLRPFTHPTKTMYSLMGASLRSFTHPTKTDADTKIDQKKPRYE